MIVIDAGKSGDGGCPGGRLTGDGEDWPPQTPIPVLHCFSVCTCVTDSLPGNLVPAHNLAQRCTEIDALHWQRQTDTKRACQ